MFEHAHDALTIGLSPVTVMFILCTYMGSALIILSQLGTGVKLNMLNEYDIRRSLRWGKRLSEFLIIPKESSISWRWQSSLIAREMSV